MLKMILRFNLLCNILLLFCSIQLTTVLGLKLNLDNVYDLLSGKVPTGLLNREVQESRNNFNVKSFVKEIKTHYANESNRNKLFEKFNTIYGKNVEREIEDENEAKELLFTRIDMIVGNNIKFLTGKSSYLLSLNSRSDKQFIRLLLQPAGNWPQYLKEYSNSVTFERALKPAQIDLIANQSVCVSSLYFTATAVIENALAKKEGTALEDNLSVQQIIDCSYNETRDQIGCYNGGYYEHIFEYVKQKGLTDWSRYPYKGLTLNCEREKEEHSIANIRNWHRIDADEKSLLKALKRHGPIAVKINLNEPLTHYHSGIFSGDDCSSGEEPNHGMLLVGHGIDSKERKMFWILKNQWGDQFGEGGYLRLERNRNNACGIASEAFYVEV